LERMDQQQQQQSAQQGKISVAEIIALGASFLQLPYEARCNAYKQVGVIFSQPISDWSWENFPVQIPVELYASKELSADVELVYWFENRFSVYLASGGQYDSFEEAYEFCKGAHVHNEPDFYGVESPAPEDPFDDLDIDDDNDDDLQQPWTDLARQFPGQDGLTRLEDQNLLGSQDLDRAYDWAPHIGMFADLRADFLGQMKVQYPVDITVHSSADPEALEFKQRQLYDLIIDDYRRFLDGETTQQFLVNLDGKATGKSHVIMLISTVLDQMVKDTGLTSYSILRAAD
jgi:hypothetical protein